MAEQHKKILENVFKKRRPLKRKSASLAGSELSMCKSFNKDSFKQSRSTLGNFKTSKTKPEQQSHQNNAGDRTNKIKSEKHFNVRKRSSTDENLTIPPVVESFRSDFYASRDIPKTKDIFQAHYLNLCSFSTPQCSRKNSSVVITASSCKPTQHLEQEINSRQCNSKPLLKSIDESFDTNAIKNPTARCEKLSSSSGNNSATFGFFPNKNKNHCDVSSCESNSFSKTFINSIKHNLPQMLKDKNSESFSEERNQSALQTSFVSLLSCRQKEDSNSVKGSKWLNSLEDVPVHCVNEVEKKNFKKIIKGGLAEQMAKLQRMEASAQAIWSHNVNVGTKGVKKPLPVAIISIYYSEVDLVILKCVSKISCLPQDSLKIALNDESEDDHIERSVVTKSALEDLTSKHELFYIFIRKSTFKNLNLEIKKFFKLFPPWQVLHLASFQYPIILCTHFIDMELTPSNSWEEIMSNLTFNDVDLDSIQNPKATNEKTLPVQNKITLNNEYLFFNWKNIISLAGRVQRIWKKNSLVPNLFSLQITDRFSVLLQTQDGIFHLLVLSNWTKLHIKEGHSYSFQPVTLLQRYDNKKDPDLFKILTAISIWQENKSYCHVSCCYQFTLDNFQTIPKEENKGTYPAYFPVELNKLIKLNKIPVHSRFSCIVRILYHCSGTFYLWDASLTEDIKYIKLQYLTNSDEITVGSVVMLKETVFDGENLLTDNYSRIIVVDNVVSCCYELGLSDDTLSCSLEIPPLKQQNFIFPINENSRNYDIVDVNGTIVSVDEQGAYTWLQCNHCDGINLVEDKNNVIYCEDCSKVVDKPLFNIKMVVILQCNSLQATVQLLTCTVKKILGIADDVLNLQCSAEDVLGQHIDYIKCVINASAKHKLQKMFYLTEIELF